MQHDGTGIAATWHGSSKNSEATLAFGSARRVWRGRLAPACAARSRTGRCSSSQPPRLVTRCCRPSPPRRCPPPPLQPGADPLPDNVLALRALLRGENVLPRALHRGLWAVDWAASGEPEVHGEVSVLLLPRSCRDRLFLHDDSDVLAVQ